MSDISKINNYIIKDATARANHSALVEEINQLVDSINAALNNKLSLSGGKLTGNVLLSNSNAQGSQPNLEWKTINSKTPYVGYCTGSTDGTFMVASIVGTTYTTGLSIGGSSGNLLWKGTKVATTSDIPTALKNPNALKFGSKTYDGSTAQTITASDIGANVTVTQKLTSGKEIGSITVGTTTTKLYAPTSSVTIDDALSTTSTNPVQNKIINNALNERKNRIWYGTCTTSAATTAKLGTCEGFNLYTGATILLKMSYTSTSTSNNTLNVNGTGAKTIYTSNYIPVQYTSTYTSSYQKPWSANDYCLFTYDGTYWVWVNAPRARMYYSNSTLYIYDN